MVYGVHRHHPPAWELKSQYSSLIKSSWSHWSICRSSRDDKQLCETGIRSRKTRDGKMSQKESCEFRDNYGDMVPCKEFQTESVAHFWTEWSQWSICSASCKHGLRQRKRDCKHCLIDDFCEILEPDEQLRDCKKGDDLEFETCNVNSCIPKSNLGWDGKEFFSKGFQVAPFEDFKRPNFGAEANIGGCVNYGQDSFKQILLG